MWKSNGSFGIIALICEDISTPILFYAPHCSRQEKVLHCMRKHVQITPHDTNTSKSHHKRHYHGKHVNETTQGRQGPRVSSHTRNHTETSETRKDAYSIPHPVPPKITPRARMVPATAPISLLVAMFTVWREKRRFFNKGISTH